MPKYTFFCIAVFLAAGCFPSGADAFGGKKRFAESSSYYAKGNAGTLTWITPDTRTVDYPPDGASLGQGWDSLSDKKVQSRCVQIAVDEAGGQVARIQTRRIFDSDSLRQSIGLDYSASAKASFGGMGGEASVKGSFVKSSEVNNQFLSVLVKGEIQNGVAFVSPVKTTSGLIELTPFATELLNRNDEGAEFLRHCGESFVAAIERGAAMYALYQFSSTERTDKKDKSTTIAGSASYMGFSGDVSSSEKSTRDAVVKNEISGLKYFHTAHRGLRLPYNEESINATLASLGSAQELAEAQPYRIKLMRYDSLPNWKHGKLKSGPATREVLLAFYYRLSDLRDTAIDIERNPKNYNLKHDHDVSAAGTLRDLLEKRMSEVAVVLSRCEELRVRLIADERQRVIGACSNQEEDVAFSDYPFRALMPIQTVRQKLSNFSEERRKALDSEIADLETLFKNTKGKGAGNLPCPVNPYYPNCRAISKQIKRVRKQLEGFLANHETRDLAESRYAYWVEAIARAREDDGLINGDLSSGELAMFRREIYCQYGFSPDSAQCPQVPLSELMHDGAVVKKSRTLQVQITGEPKSDSTEALESLQDQITRRVSAEVKHKPHYFDVVDPSYKAGTAGEQKTFSFSGKISITYFDHDAPQILRLLTPP